MILENILQKEELYTLHNMVYTATELKRFNYNHLGVTKKLPFFHKYCLFILFLFYTGGTLIERY
jgi:hypothetical protein